MFKYFFLIIGIVILQIRVFLLGIPANVMRGMADDLNKTVKCEAKMQVSAVVRCMFVKKRRNNER